MTATVPPSVGAALRARVTQITADTDASMRRIGELSRTVDAALAKARMGANDAQDALSKIEAVAQQVKGEAHVIASLRSAISAILDEMDRIAPQGET